MLGIAQMMARDMTSRSPAELLLFGDVTLLLYQHASIDCREKLSRELAHLAQTPTRLAMKLACDDIKVAMPMLLNSPALSQANLCDIAKTKSQNHLQVIARRKDLDPVVSDIVIERGHLPVQRIITGNREIRLSRKGLMALVGPAKSDPVLKEDLLLRSDLTPAVCQQMLPFVDEPTRARLKGLIEGALSPEQLDQIARLRSVRRGFGPAMDTQDVRKLWADAQNSDIVIDDLIILMLQDNRLSHVCELLGLVSRRPAAGVRDAIFNNDTEQVVEIALNAGLEIHTVALLAQARCKHLRVPANQAGAWTKAYTARLAAPRKNAKPAPEFAAKRRGKHSKGRAARSQPRSSRIALN